jgi:hypothetical protein
MDPVTTICGIERDEYRTELEYRERASDRISPLIKKQADSFRKRFTCVEYRMCDAVACPIQFPVSDVTMCSVNSDVIRVFASDNFELRCNKFGWVHY